MIYWPQTEKNSHYSKCSAAQQYDAMEFLKHFAWNHAAREGADVDGPAYEGAAWEVVESDADQRRALCVLPGERQLWRWWTRRESGASCVET